MRGSLSFYYIPLFATGLVVGLAFGIGFGFGLEFVEMFYDWYRSDLL